MRNILKSTPSTMQKWEYTWITWTPWRGQFHVELVTFEAISRSLKKVENKVYTNVDPVLRHAVDQIPASDWLKGHCR